ncbi:hypothetical protein EDC55_10587 [Allofrancisella inopinata]|uniref:Uncharacterized protein n=1 Tax=Allofrancisella inopinata TaxID=1085647 RepID=A0AAE7CQH1_9GAMM|nr:hypothetical protein [Allofrancisella inopinata]QIV95895.1 hypothetical protein E4K63_03250 [Allofrancisella inopinata]TDT72936.1 hypothetical protein EDC55_10587 [Allofrancisella inopinata]
MKRVCNIFVIPDEGKQTMQDDIYDAFINSEKFWRNSFKNKIRDDLQLEFDIIEHKGNLKEYKIHRKGQSTNELQNNNLIRFKNPAYLNNNRSSLYLKEQYQHIFINFLNSQRKEYDCIYKQQNTKLQKQSFVEFLMKNLESPTNCDHLSPILEWIENIKYFISHYKGLIIESTGTTGVHPIFYKKNVVIGQENHDKCGHRSNNSLFICFFSLVALDTAIKSNKVIYGTCHGAQLGWILLGGGMEKIPFVDNPSLEGIAQWSRTHKTQNNNKGLLMHDGMISLFKDVIDYKNIPLDTFKHNYEYLKIINDNNLHENSEKFEYYINKDFNHTLLMTAPIPDKEQLSIDSYHPLSSIPGAKDSLIKFSDTNLYPNEYVGRGDEYSKDIGKQIIVDAFHYNTFYGFQYHPQYTFKNSDTALIFHRIIFDLYKITLN